MRLKGIMKSIPQLPPQLEFRTKNSFDQFEFDESGLYLIPFVLYQTRFQKNNNRAAQMLVSHSGFQNVNGIDRLDFSCIGLHMHFHDGYLSQLRYGDIAETPVTTRSCQFYSICTHYY